MRYYIIGNKDSTKTEYENVAQWLMHNGHKVITPMEINIGELTEQELKTIKMLVINWVDVIFVLDKNNDTDELAFAKILGKKIKYLSKQWKLRKEKKEATTTEDSSVVRPERNTTSSKISFLYAENKIDKENPVNECKQTKFI